MPFLTAAGHALEYEWIDAGDGSRPALVFLHEGLGSIRQWRDFPLEVARATGCRALVYNRYGYGQSDVLAEPRAPAFMHDEARIVLPEVLRTLGVRAPILVGHSDGASIAMIHAGSGYPVRGLVLMAPHVFVEAMNVKAIAEIGASFEASGLAARLGKYHRDPVRTFRGWNDVWLLPAFREWNIEALLPAIRCPVLALQGADDQYGTAAQLEAVARQVGGPCETLMLPGCGHAPFRDQPAATLEATVRFVDSLVSRQSA